MGKGWKAGLNAERRVAPREDVEPIPIRALTSLDHMTLLSRSGHIVEASKTGFLLEIERKNLVPRHFRENINLDEIVGDRILLMIDPLNLELGGRVVRVQKFNKDVYQIAIDFSDDSPEYWRECLMDFLPTKMVMLSPVN